MAMPGGIGAIDQMLAIGGGDQRGWYEKYRPLLRDRESLEQFEMPAQYLPARRRSGGRIAPAPATGECMRIGVVSDTHNNLRNVARIVEIFNQSDVERVVHTGDITRASTLEALSGLHMPLMGVFGNNDVERDSLLGAAKRFGMKLVDPPLRIELHGHSISVVHDPLDISEALTRESSLLLHGHNHRHIHEHRNGCLVFNPGECAGIMAGLNAVGVVDLASLRADLLKF